MIMTWQQRPQKVWQPGEKVATWIVALLLVAACWGMGAYSIHQGHERRVRDLGPPGAVVLASIKPCEHEDGSGESQTYPCQWDARIRGNGEWSDDYPPVLVYVRGTDAGCPRLPDIARCFDVDEWTQES